ncbi:MAG: hypothetical protein ACOYT4_00350 [Nanoarchaeota archaeon]
MEKLCVYSFEEHFDSKTYPKKLSGEEINGIFPADLENFRGLQRNVHYSLSLTEDSNKSLLFRILDPNYFYFFKKEWPNNWNEYLNNDDVIDSGIVLLPAREISQELDLCLEDLHFSREELDRMNNESDNLFNNVCRHMPFTKPLYRIKFDTLNLNPFYRLNLPIPLPAYGVKLTAPSCSIEMLNMKTKKWIDTGERHSINPLEFISFLKGNHSINCILNERKKYLHLLH